MRSTIISIFAVLLLLGVIEVYGAGETVITMENCWSFDTADISGTTAYDNGTELNNATMTSITLNTTGCVVGQCIERDAITDVTNTIKNLNFNGGHSRTFMFWAKIPGLPAGANLFASGAAADCQRWSAQIQDGANNHDFRGYASCDVLTIGSSPEAWTHFAYRYDSNATLDIFVNGTRKSNTAMTLNTGAGILHIGNVVADNNGMDGFLDEFKVYNGSLPDANISADYNGGSGVNCIKRTTLVFEYKPGSYIRGRWITMTAFLIVAGLLGYFGFKRYFSRSKTESLK